jgi:hypothetical protein
MITNINTKTGIHYGAISMHQVTQSWCDLSEPVRPEDLSDDEIAVYDSQHTDYQFHDASYDIISILDSDLLVIASPYYTFTRLCSPCVPNAGDLNNPNEESGVKTYCLGPDWFDDGVAPYKVYPVPNPQ